MSRPSHFFSSDEALALGSVLWQLHHMQNEARRMEQWLNQSVALTGEGQEKAVANYDSARKYYRDRLPIILDFVRRAKEALS